MQISDERNERVKRLFWAALDLPVARRTTFVEEACAGDENLRREVLELLLYHGDADSRLESPLHAEAGSALEETHPASIGKFRILGVLGRGGMGVVYLAEQDEPPRRLALKALSAEMRTPEALARFRREVEVLRQIEHPGIARFHEAGVLEAKGGALPYLAMEVVEGLPLTAAAEQAGLDTRAKLELLAEVCDAVAYAHRLGIVHRDLKPDNILVRAGGHPVILDFGVSRIAGHDSELGSLATRTGLLLGTPQYMSPEQAQGLPGAVGPQADVYALGVVAFELLGGHTPYDAQNVSLHRAMVLILTVEAPRLGTLDPSLRGDVESIVAQALEKRPEDRYPSAGELGADIRRHLSRQRVRARRIGRLRASVRALRRKPLRALFAVVLLTAVGTALMTRGLIPRTRGLSLEEIQTRFEAILASIESAERMIQGPRGPRPREELLQALWLLEQARQELARIPSRPYTPTLKRYTLIRSGEAQVFLGVMNHDPEPLGSALSYLDEARRTPEQAAALAQMDSTALRERIGREKPYRVISLMGTVRTALASYETPLSHLHTAHGERGIVMSTVHSLADSLRVQGAYDDKLIYQITRNDFGESLVRWGATAADLQLVDRGFDVLISTLKDGGMPWVTPAHASLLANLGTACMHRGELTHSPADLDSALRYLGAALALRPPERRLVHAETRRALAEAGLVASRFGSTAQARLEYVEAALRHAGLGLDVLEESDHPAAFQFLRMTIAEALSERAALAGTLSDLVTADSLLQLGEPIFTRPSRPLQHAQLQLVHAVTLRVRWELRGDERARDEARRRLEIAQDLVSREEDPRFHARLDQEVRRLGG